MTAHVLDDLARELQPEFEIIRPLGAGATATVYLAREPALQRLVAVKVLRPELAADAVVCRRFEREAQAAARISHEHVTAIYRVGSLSDGVPYLVMEYIDGRTVRDILDAREQFELAEACTLLAAVASALAAAHDKGIVHRDLRPENAFIENRTGRAVLADFGTVALLESGSAPSPRLTAAGVRMGDLRHMSPEQVRGETVTEQSDVYSFGVFAYEVLGGRGPYDVRTEAEAVAAHLNQEPRRLRELRPDLDARLAGLIERSLSKEPNRRPRAREIAAGLDPDTGPAAVQPPPDAPLAFLLDELKRRKVYRVLAGYGAVALAALGGTQAVYEAFDLPAWSYRLLVAALLGGFPLAIALSWVYDIRGRRIVRTQSEDARRDRRFRILVWGGLAVSVLTVTLLGWFLLRNA